jgi:ABC-type sugar transport system ATPase subunit
MIRLADRIVVMREHRVVADLENTRDYAEMSEPILAAILSEATTSPRYRIDGTDGPGGAT